MKNINFKKILPHIIAVITFLIVAVVYCKPALEGKVVQQHDIQGWRGMSQQSVEYKDKYGFYPLWTNSMFSGMPAYQIALDAKTKIQVGFADPALTLWLPKPISFFFLACISFYFFCLVAGANPYVSMLGAIAYAYSTFDPIIVAVGHNTQMVSIGYMPAMLAGLLLLFRKKFWAGFAITALFSSLLIGQNHLQMVYYTLLVAGIMTIAFLVKSYREKAAAAVIKPVILGLIAGLLGLACNAVSMMPTYEYAKESMRGGKSELTLGNDKDGRNKTKGGLDKDYAFRFSVGIPETFTLVVPGVYGGGVMGREHGASSKFVEKVTEAGVPEENAVQMVNNYSYWGEQHGTAGPVYLGAVVFFLFIFGAVYIKGWHKWWTLAASIFGILLAWGSNFQAFNYFLFDHLPFYNKFRAPSMSLVIPQLCFPFLGVLALSKLVNATDTGDLWKKLKLSVMITGGVLLLLIAFYFSASFSSSTDKDLKSQFKQSMLQQVPPGQQPSQEILQQSEEISRQLISALHTDRKDLMGADLLRNILLIGLAVILTGLFVKRKIKPVVLIAGLFILSSFDLLSVAKRYLNDDNFVEDTDFESAFTPTEADQQILRDPDHANFRVFNNSVDSYNDASTSFHHNSIGGYHPAKLGLYQDIIENQLSKGNMRVFNMLNTKYFIDPDPKTGRPFAQVNPGAMGNCWLVKGIKWVNGANEEMKALDSTDLKDTAVIEKSFASIVKPPAAPDSAATIKLGQNLNDKIDYTFNSNTPQFAVFSEVYYPYGWNAYIDGKKAEYVKVNYILRGMNVPAGKHAVEFRFEPKSFTTGRMITIWSNIIILLAILASIFFYVRRRNRPDTHIL